MSTGELNKKYQQEWRNKNREYVRERQRNKRNELRTWFRSEILTQYKCVKCGNDHPAVLDFHHRDPSQKYIEIGEMAGNKCSKEKILEEVAKCDVLCANCHRVHHWEERDYNRE